MANRVINATLLPRRDTAANWESKNPVLQDGEFITVITNAGAVRHKVGDGTKTYSQLPFEDEPLYSALADKTNIKRSLTIPTTGWTTGATEAPSGMMYVDITQSDTTAEMMPIVSMSPSGADIAKVCGMSMTARAMNGTIRLYAASAPASSITAELTLVKVAAASGMTNNGYGVINAPSAGGGINYGVCGTTAATQTKTVTINGINSLSEGLSIRVKFSNAQSYSGQPKLNLNSLGAVNIVRNGTTAAAQYEWNAGEVLDFVYDGTNWVIADGAIATTTYFGLTKLNSSSTSSSTTEAATPSAVKAVNDRLTYGTADKTPGTDSLTTGVIYLVYE